MIRIARDFALAAVAACLFAGAIGAANAAGALAVGVCGAYGYGFDYQKIEDARAAAMSKCSGGSCMAVDAKNPCGSFGWAVGPHLGKAENASMRRCVEFGGRDCVVRAWACDEKG
jgi:hypothetical protein